MPAVDVRTQEARIEKYPALFKGDAFYFFYCMYEDSCKSEGIPMTDEGIDEFMQALLDRVSLCKAIHILISALTMATRESYVSFHKKIFTA